MFATFQQSADRNFVRSVTGMARNNPPPPYFDFMHVVACMPKAQAGFGYDASVAPTLDLHTPGGGHPDYFRWTPTSAAADPRNNHEQLTKWCRVVTTVQTFAGNIGDYDDTRTPKWNGRLVSFTITTVRTLYNYYQNQVDLKQGHLDAACADDETTVTDGKYVPSGSRVTNPTVFNPGDDKTKTGLPTGCDITDEYYFHVTDPWGATWHLADFAALASDAWKSHDSTIAPTLTDASFSATYSYPYNGSEDFTNANYVSIISESTTFSSPYSMGELVADTNTLLASVSLSPKSNVTTREGPLYFDYFGIKAADTTRPNLIPAGQVYDGSGKYTVTGLAYGQAYGVNAGANETVGGITSYGLAGLFDDVGYGSYAPGLQRAVVNSSFYTFYWGTDDTHHMTGHDGGKYMDWFTVLRYNDENNWNGATLARSGTSGGFVARATSLVMNGTAGAAVTAHITKAHVNLLTVFPCGSGGASVTIITAQKSVGTNFPLIYLCEQNTDDNGNYSPLGFAIGSLILSKSLVRVPKNPASVTQDDTLFANIDGFFPSTTTEVWAANLPDYSDIRTYFDGIITPGEHIFMPSDVPLFATKTFCEDGKYGTTTPQPTAPQTEGAGDGNSGAGG